VLLRDGEALPIGARAFDLLVALALKPGRLVTKSELLDLAWPGLVVEEANIQVQVSALRKLIGPRAITTIPGLGYRFSAVLEMQADVSAVDLMGDVTAELDLSLPDKPSVAILPFTNMSVDPSHAHIADAVTEDITTELSRFHSLFVIGRHSTLTYRGRAIDVRTIASQLGVRYVVDGSVRRLGDRTRVTAQLIDASTRKHVWAEHYDRAPEEIFAVQEEVVQSIVMAIAPEVTQAETAKARRQRPNNLTAYGLALKAWADAWASFRNPEPSRLDAIALQAEQALAIDRDCTLALNAAAFVQWLRVFYRGTPSATDAWHHGMSMVRRAIDLDRTDSLGYVVKAALLTHEPNRGCESIRYDEALDDLRRAHRLNPNDHVALRLLGHTEAVSGDARGGIAHLQQALRLNPRDPGSINVIGMLSLAHFFARDYAQGVKWGLQAAAGGPAMPNHHVFLAMNLVGAGEIARATAAYDVARQLSPEYVLARINGFSVFRRPEDRLRQRIFLRIAAGLEDPAAANVHR